MTLVSVFRLESFSLANHPLHRVNTVWQLKQIPTQHASQRIKWASKHTCIHMCIHANTMYDKSQDKNWHHTHYWMIELLWCVHICTGYMCTSTYTHTSMITQNYAYMANTHSDWRREKEIFMAIPWPLIHFGTRRGHTFCPDLIWGGEKTDDKGDHSECPVTSGNNHKNFRPRQALVSVLNTVEKKFKNKALNYRVLVVNSKIWIFPIFLNIFVHITKT